MSEKVYTFYHLVFDNNWVRDPRPSSGLVTYKSTSSARLTVHYLGTATPANIMVENFQIPAGECVWVSLESNIVFVPNC
jgi:hypothetical protein